MGESKELSEELWQKMIYCHKAGEGYKKISKHLSIPISTIVSIIKKYKTHGTGTTPSVWKKEGFFTKNK
ncbi:UNVERIFIED_CONTAM: hypothetical protein FKN15_057914 [Acipenser sinensis]